jgi:hypothetical protein
MQEVGINTDWTIELARRIHALANNLILKEPIESTFCGVDNKIYRPFIYQVDYQVMDIKNRKPFCFHVTFSEEYFKNKATEISLSLNKEDREKLLIPTIEALAKGLPFFDGKKKSINKLPAFARDLWVDRLKDEVTAFGEGKLVFQSQSYERRWRELLMLDECKSLMLVSSGEEDIWLELIGNSDVLKEEENKAWLYHKPIKEFQGIKKRIFIVNQENYEKHGSPWPRIESFLVEKIGMDIAFINPNAAERAPDNLDKQNFGIIEGVCVIFGQEKGLRTPFGYKSTYSFREDDMKNAMDKWEYLESEAWKKFKAVP